MIVGVFYEPFDGQHVIRDIVYEVIDLIINFADTIKFNKPCKVYQIEIVFLNPQALFFFWVFDILMYMFGNTL